MLVCEPGQNSHNNRLSHGAISWQKLGIRLILAKESDQAISYTITFQHYLVFLRQKFPPSEIGLVTYCNHLGSSKSWGMCRLGNRSVRVSDFSLQKLRFSALCGPNERKFCILLTWPRIISPQHFLSNLSTDGQENAIFGAKNTNPHTAISKHGHVKDLHCTQLLPRLLLNSSWYGTERYVRGENAVT